MGKLFDHTNCPNPVQWGNSPVKTVYVRDNEAGKTTWKPVGYICTGCGVFRSKSGWFPSGRTSPICDPWRPEKTPIESINETINNESESIANVPGLDNHDNKPFTHTLEAHIDYGGPGRDLEGPEEEARYAEGPIPCDTCLNNEVSCYRERFYARDEGGYACDYYRPAAEDEARPRVTTRKLQKILGLSREEVIVRVKSGEIPVEKDKHRHWSVPREWYDAARTK